MCLSFARAKRLTSLSVLQLGDCDFDDDCAEGLVCFQRNAGTAVPGCSAGNQESFQTDFCVDPSAMDPDDGLPQATELARAASFP